MKSVRCLWCLALLLAANPAVANPSVEQPAAENPDTPTYPADSCQAEELEAIAAMEAGYAQAVADLDMQKVMTYYVNNDSLVVFDQQLPRQYIGRQAMIDNWTHFLDNKVESLDSYSASGMKMWIASSCDLAGGLLFHTSDLTLLDGSKFHLVLRITHVLVKENGRWVIQHEHGSFPIDWETGTPDYLSKE